ncbi:D-alanyl-D-alanine carboxypeptidase family protein [Clostridium chrysemydis]|uniref:D-alanyl-D-alanine carboxypeptidase family protein n=1 Tax=Clostridium chrysemydis TaxID=2665504 RepID=UPI001883630F|nr:D-alanyl-D-alanine carboxypeptidase family protein [Clostridium chrysemydis]
MKKKVYLISTLLSFLLLFNSIIPVYATENKKLKVSARHAIAYSRKTGQIIFEQNAYQNVPIASTTKILTALVAIESENLNKEFSVSKNAVSVRGSKVGYKIDEKVKLEELLHGLLFKSGNDAAIIIAEGISGSVEEYCKLMSHYSISIGAIDSHFTTPHGLDDIDHYSSAYDLALITSKAMENEIFRNIVSKKEINKSDFSRSYNNINKILWKIPQANGVKTGYTGGAGKCLVSSIKHSGDDIIIVVLDCPDRWNQTEKIFNFVKENYRTKTKDINTYINDNNIVKAYKNNIESDVEVLNESL